MHEFWAIPDDKEYITSPVGSFQFKDQLFHITKLDFGTPQSAQRQGLSFRVTDDQNLPHAEVIGHLEGDTFYTTNFDNLGYRLLRTRPNHLTISLEFFKKHYGNFYYSNSSLDWLLPLICLRVL